MGQGFRNVRCLRGGIDAWSSEVDAKIPRYRLETVHMNPPTISKSGSRPPCATRKTWANWQGPTPWAPPAAPPAAT